MTKRLGIAFGGSGAEGIAGIAYVKALEELGIKPSVVSGTGVGGVIAAMYAAGMSGDDMVAFLEEIDFPGAKRPINVNKVKDAKFGILDDMGLEEYFQMVVPVKVFDRLYFPLKIAAANYETGSAVVFSDGDMGPAVRAGVAIPGIFSPYEKDEVTYIDGSCVNPVPFDIIRDDCDVLICIDPEINQRVDEQGRSPFVFPAIMSAYSAAKKALVEEKKKNCKVDHYARVLVDDINMFDFVQYPVILEAVEEQAEKFKAIIKEIVE